MHVALKEAQEKGFAESNPRLDVQAFDPKYKLTILLCHTFGVFVKPDDVFNFGIQNLSAADSTFAREKGFKIKLIAHTSKLNGKVIAYVIPTLVNGDNMFYAVRNEFNAVQLGCCIQRQTVFLRKRGRWASYRFCCII